VFLFFFFVGVVFCFFLCFFFVPVRGWLVLSLGVPVGGGRAFRGFGVRGPPPGGASPAGPGGVVGAGWGATRWLYDMACSTGQATWNWLATRELLFSGCSQSMNWSLRWRPRS
jgi:hypothetical protein